MYSMLPTLCWLHELRVLHGSMVGARRARIRPSGCQELRIRWKLPPPWARAVGGTWRWVVGALGGGPRPAWLGARREISEEEVWRRRRSVKLAANHSNGFCIEKQSCFSSLGQSYFTVLGVFFGSWCFEEIDLGSGISYAFKNTSNCSLLLLYKKKIFEGAGRVRRGW